MDNKKLVTEINGYVIPEGEELTEEALEELSNNREEGEVV